MTTGTSRSCSRCHEKQPASARFCRRCGRSWATVRTTPPKPASQCVQWWRFEPLNRTGFRVGWSWLSTLIVAELASLFIESPGIPEKTPAATTALWLGWFVVVFLTCFTGGVVFSYIAWKSLRKSYVATSIGWAVGLSTVLFLLNGTAKAAAHNRHGASLWAELAKQDQLSRVVTRLNQEHTPPPAHPFTGLIPPPPAGGVLDARPWKNKSLPRHDEFGGTVIESPASRDSAVISRPALDSDTPLPVSLIAALRGTIRKLEGGVLEGELEEPPSWALSSLTIRWTVFDAQGNVLVSWRTVSRVFLRVPRQGEASVRFDVPPACNALPAGERLTWSIEDAKGSVAR